MSLRWYFSLRAGISMGVIGVIMFVGGGMQIYNATANRPKFVEVSIEDLENGKLPNKDQRHVRIKEHVAIYPMSVVEMEVGKSIRLGRTYYPIVSVERAEKEVGAEVGEDGTIQMTPEQERRLTQHCAVFVMSEKFHAVDKIPSVATKRSQLQGEIDLTIEQNIYDMFSEPSGRLDFRGCVEIDEEGRRPSILLGVGVLLLSFAVLGAAAYMLGNLDAD